MSSFFLILAAFCFFIGLIQLFTPAPYRKERSAGDDSASSSDRWPRPQQSTPLAGSFRWTERSSNIAMGSGSRSAGVSAQPEISTPLKLNWIELGQRIVIKHPQRGALMVHVLGHVLYIELWQKGRGAQVPWTPTGSAFLGFVLEGGMYLLNWQSRFYILDQSTEISDSDIQRDFAPHARQFAQSDQTADVHFAYPPAMWHIDDIGKFRIAAAEGDASQYRLGAVGRFIHSSGDSARALVVEDYEGGGGQDIVWSGYQIQEADIALA